MIRYASNRQVDPPAPFVHVSLSCPETGQAVSDLPAQIDTAADRTVIPGYLVKSLGLLPLDELPVSGFGGQVFLMPTYREELGLRNLSVQAVEVLARGRTVYLARPGRTESSSVAAGRPEPGAGGRLSAA